MQAWHYVMVEPANLNMFKEQVSTGTIDFSKFGEILISEWGVKGCSRRC